MASEPVSKARRYGLRVSADLISRVTDAVLEEVSDWQNRALEPVYPIVFLDALRVKIRDSESRQVKNKAVYVALGVTPEGEREVLGLWIAANAPLGHFANALPGSGVPNSGFRS